MIELGQKPSLKPGDNLGLKPNQMQLVDKLQKDAAFTGTVIVATCLNCIKPVASIVGPKVRNVPTPDNRGQHATVRQSACTDLASFWCVNLIHMSSFHMQPARYFAC
jgi:hypothetical protein